MDNKNNHIDQILKDKFLSFEADIPMSDWSLIEQKLNNNNRKIWYWWTAIPILLILGFGIYFYNHTDKSTSRKEVIISNSKVKGQISQSGFESKDKASALVEESTQPSPSTFKRRIESNDDKVNPILPHQIISPDLHESEQDKINQAKDFDYVNLLSKTYQSNFVFTSNFETQKLIVLPFKPYTSKREKKVSYEFGLSLSPAFALDAFKANNNKLINRSYFSSIGEASSFGQGFNQGIHFQINFGKHWFIRQGFYGSDYTVNHDYNYTITEHPHVSTVNKVSFIEYYAPLDTANFVQVNVSGKSSIKYFSVPLSVGHRTNFSEKFGLESKLGINVSRLLSAKGQIVNPTSLYLEDIKSNNIIKKWNTGVSISTGIFYKPNNSLIFTVEPNFNTLLSPASTKNYPVKVKYYNYGINFNLNYKLGGNKR